MFGKNSVRTTKFSHRQRTILAFICLFLLVAGCSKSEDSKSEAAAKLEQPGSKSEQTNSRVDQSTAKPGQSGSTLDTSRLPRVAGAKQILASPATTIFTTPDPVAQTADALDKALGTAGWQSYVAPATAPAKDPNMRIMTLKKGTQALSVFVTIAPAENNATSVQYAVVPLKTDLPFSKDATQVEYAPDKPLLMLVTQESLDKTLDFYRQELAARGWALWSQKLNAKQPADGHSGLVHRNGAYAQYVNDKEPTVTLALSVRDAGAGKNKVEIEEWPIAVLQTGIAMSPAPQIDVRRLPRLEGAVEDPARTSTTHLSYNFPHSLADTIAATERSLAADGWQEYFRPDDESHDTLKFFKKGAQGLTVSFYIPKPTESIVEYSPAWIYVDLPFPDAATDVVFDNNRPYLNCVTTGTVDSVLDFYQKELGAEGWVPLRATQAAAHWPSVKLDGKVYFTREKQQPILLSLHRRDDGKIAIDIRVAPFAQPQNLAVGSVYYGLPTPKFVKTAGGIGGDREHKAEAMVTAEIGAVLAFYRRELTARNWKEESDGAAVTPDAVTIKFTSPEGPAVLKLGRRYDMTTVSLIQQLPKPAVRVETAQAAPTDKPASVDDAMKKMQEMMQGLNPGAKPPAATPPPAPAPGGNAPALQATTDSKAPLPVPDTADEVEYDAADGRLAFSSGSPLQAVAEFYRSAMKQQDWDSRSSVINNANIVVLNFAKAGKAVSFTIMRMGDKTNVEAQGSGLKVATANATKAVVHASTDDLEAEESGGLPLPKRHTMSVGGTTGFRRELNASVPLELADVLGFYRRELGKRQWKEDGKSAVVTADSAKILYTSPEGPAVLNLSRKDDATSVNLVVKNPAEAAKAGVVPKPGRALVMLGNINDAAATITFNGKPLHVAAGAGTKGPDGPMLDLPPGKYKYSIKLPGKPMQSDAVEVSADETWGLMIGPGGVLALQAY